MPSLFSDQFPVFKNSAQLAALQKEYADYDPYYVTSGCIKERKVIFEDLYRKFAPYADSHFLQQVKIDFHQRTWEMYLACTLLEHGFQITSDDNGPDIKLEAEGRNIWIECVAPKHGDANSLDRVPEEALGSHYVPDEQILFRLVSVLNEKHTKYQKYLENGTVKPNDIYIIAVNRGNLGYFDGEIPLIFKCLFAIGDLTMPIDIETHTAGDSYYPFRPAVPKKNGSGVPMGFYGNETHGGISAVIYSTRTVVNRPERLGDDCILVHNPFAFNPLPEDCFSFLEQHKVKEDLVIKI